MIVGDTNGRYFEPAPGRNWFAGVSVDVASLTRRPRYTRVAVVLHWLVAALVVAQVSWGWWMQTIAKQPPGVRADAFNLHKSIGLVMLALTLVRLGWRLAHPPPPLPRPAALAGAARAATCCSTRRSS